MSSPRKKVLAVTAALALATSVSGCSVISDKISEAAGEKVAEKVIEGATGGNVDIDVKDDEGSISFKMDDGETKIQTGSFIDGWPSNLTYPSDYSIITSSMVDNEDQLAYMSLVSSQIDYEQLVDQMRSSHEGSGFTLVDEPFEMSYPEYSTIMMNFEGSEYNLILTVASTPDQDPPSSVQYMVLFDK